MIDQASNQLNLVVESFATFFNQLATFLPKLIGALLILIIGWMVAKAIQAVSVRLFRLIRLDQIAQKTGIDAFLNEGGFQGGTIHIMGKLFYWMIMFIVFLAAFNSLNLQVASDLFNEIVMYIPNVVVAILILVFGLYIGRLVAGIVVTYLKNIGIEQADNMGKIVQAAFVFLVISMVLRQLNIGGELVSYAFLILFGATCLALALAFGLGGKQWAANILEGFHSNNAKDKVHEGV